MQRTFTEVQNENDKQIVRLARELQELEKFFDKKIGTMLPLVDFNQEKAGFARIEEIRNIEYKISNLAQSDEIKQEFKSLKSGIEIIKAQIKDGLATTDDLDELEVLLKNHVGYNFVALSGNKDQRAI